MSFRIQSQSGRTTYNLKKFTVDTFADISKIAVRELAVGSTVFVIDTSENYMLNSQRQWIKVKLGGGTAIADPEEYQVVWDAGVVKADNDEDVNGIPDLEEGDVIWNGGEEKE